MANVPIPNLPAAIALSGGEQMEAVQAGTSIRLTTAQIASLSSGTLATQIPTAAALRALTTSTSYPVVFMQSYSGTIGDGAAGAFVYNSGDTSSGWYGTASISGTALTLQSTVNGTMAIGLALWVPGQSSPVWIVSGSGTSWTFSGSGLGTISTTTMSTDNGGTYAVDQAGRRWDRSLTNFVTPAMFGWQSGSTDYTYAVNAAAAAATALQYELWLGPGTYSTASGFNFSTYGTSVEQNAPPRIRGSGRAVNGTNLVALSGATYVVSMQNVANTYLGDMAISANGVSTVTTALDTSWNVTGASNPSQENTYENLTVTNTNSGSSNLVWNAYQNLDSTYDSISLIGVAGQAAIKLVGEGGGVSFRDMYVYPGYIGIDVQSATLTGDKFVAAIGILGVSTNFLNINGGQIAIDSVLGCGIYLASGSTTQGITGIGVYAPMGSASGQSLIGGSGELNTTAIFKGGYYGNGVNTSTAVGSSVTTSSGNGGNVAFEGGFFGNHGSEGNSNFSVTFKNVLTGSGTYLTPNSDATGARKTQQATLQQDGLVYGDGSFQPPFGISRDYYGEVGGITSSNPIVLTGMPSAGQATFGVQGGSEFHIVGWNSGTVTSILSIGASPVLSFTAAYTSGSWHLTISSSSSSPSEVLYKLTTLAL